MQLKLTAPHWLGVGVGLVGTIAPSVGKAFPSMAPVCAEVTELVPLILTALAVMTGSAMVPSVPPSKVDVVTASANELSK